MKIELTCESLYTTEYMKKLLGTLVLLSLLISSPANAGYIGSGELKIGETTFESFLDT